MTKAQLARYDAIHAISKKYAQQIPSKGKADDKLIGQIIDDIDKLVYLGRTDRWRGTVKQWSRAMLRNDNSHWTFFQYGIWASHAA